ncbi:MAG: MOSC domain-containing protein [Chloroflexota bacterium]
MTLPAHLTMAQLEAGLDYIRQAPKDNGTLELIVRRPRDDERDALAEAQLDAHEGLIGDNWKTRGSGRMPDGSAHPDMQLTLMNARVIQLLAQSPERWSLAGDQLYVDLDLSEENLPPGTRLAMGSAVIEVTAEPHTGCKKFAARYGQDAVKFVNSAEGRQLHMRGINARIIQSGVVRVGDKLTKV